MGGIVAITRMARTRTRITTTTTSSTMGSGPAAQTNRALPCVRWCRGDNRLDVVVSVAGLKGADDGELVGKRSESGEGATELDTG